MLCSDAGFDVKHNVFLNDLINFQNKKTINLSKNSGNHNVVCIFLISKWASRSRNWFFRVNKMFFTKQLVFHVVSNVCSMHAQNRDWWFSVGFITAFRRAQTSKLPLPSCNLKMYDFTEILKTHFWRHPWWNISILLSSKSIPARRCHPTIKMRRVYMCFFIFDKQFTTVWRMDTPRKPPAGA